MISKQTTLYIGNRNYSSWSLRPWLVLKWARIAFAEQLIELDQAGYTEGGIAEILALSPNGKVPALHISGRVIWDSLAISEWAAERDPTLWPADAWARAHARSVCAEMHSGFANLRNDLTMNIRRRCQASALSAATERDIARVDQLINQARQSYQSQGPHLFGRRSIADAFYTPVATRFRTYGIKLSDTAQAYCEVLLKDPAFLLWEREVLRVPHVPFRDFDQCYLGTDRSP